MLRPQTDIPAGSETRRLTGQTASGLGIAIEPTPHGIRYEHGGNNGEFQADMMFFRDQRIGYVFLTNSDSGDAFKQRPERFMTTGR